jgi:hypothetical protein
MNTSIEDDKLDTGIRNTVLILLKNGIETFESCQGGKGHAFFEPTVRFHGNKAEGLRAVSIAMNNGLKVSNLRRYWTLEDGELQGAWWELTFQPQPNPVFEEWAKNNLIEPIDVAEKS